VLTELAVGRLVPVQQQRRISTDRRAEGIDDTALPRGIGVDGCRTHSPGTRAEPGCDGLVERLDHDTCFIEANDLAKLRLVA
jgi:hypothetical protein